MKNQTNQKEGIAISHKVAGIVIGKVIYKDKEYPLYLSKLDEFNDIACCLDKWDPHIEVNMDWIIFTRMGIINAGGIWHELGHLYLNTPNEYLADRFTCQRIGLDLFMRFIDDRFMNSLKKLKYRREKIIFRSYCDYRINSMDNITKINDSYKLIFNEEFDTIPKIGKAWDEKFK